MTQAQTAVKVHPDDHAVSRPFQRLVQGIKDPAVGEGTQVQHKNSDPVEPGRADVRRNINPFLGDGFDIIQRLQTLQCRKNDLHADSIFFCKSPHGGELGCRTVLAVEDPLDNVIRHRHILW